jgi:hypothetical protein
MTMSKTKLIIAVLFVISPLTANAELTIWEATGTLTTVDTSGGFISDFPTAAVGSEFRLLIEFESSTPVSSINSGGDWIGNRYRYGDALISMSLSIDGVALERAQDGFKLLDIWDNFGLAGTPTTSNCFEIGVACDGFVAAQDFESSQAAGFAQVALILRGTEHLDIYSGPGLPTTPSPLLTALSTTLVQFVDESDVIVGNVDSVSRGKRAFALIASLSDINSNDSPEIAVVVEGGSNHVHIRDGSTDELLSDIDFGDDPVIAMAIIDDVSGNDKAEIAVLGTRPNGTVWVQVKDSDTGTTGNNIFYGSAFPAVDMAVLTDTNGNDANELAVVGVNGSGLVRVLARDSLTDATTSTTYYGNQAPPMDVLTIADVSGNNEPEMLVHGVVTANSLGRAKMRDSSTGALVRDLYFGSVYTPIELVAIGDVSGDGIADVAQLGRRADTGLVRVLVRRTDTGAIVTNAYAGFTNAPIAVVGIADANGNSSPDLAILVKTPAGTAKVVIRDGATGAFIRTIIAASLNNPLAMTLVADMNANGSPELAILGDDNAGTRQVKIKDSLSGLLVNTIDFP